MRSRRLALVGWFLVGSLGALGCAEESQPASVTVELDVFSGEPNPSWVLDSSEARELQRRLSDLPAANDGKLPEGRLGVGDGVGSLGVHVLQVHQLDD